MLDRRTGSWVPRLSRLEEAKDMFRARCRPKCEELVIRVGEGPTAADRHEARVSDLREDHVGRPTYGAGIIVGRNEVIYRVGRPSTYGAAYLSHRRHRALIDLECAVHVARQATRTIGR